MTIDERLDKLATLNEEAAKRDAEMDARLGVLTMNVQLLSDMMKDFLKAHDDNERRYKLLAAIVEQHGTRLDKLDGGR